MRLLSSAVWRLLLVGRWRCVQFRICFFKHNPSKCHLCDLSLNNHIPILGSNYTGNPLIQLMTPSRFLSSLCNLPCIDAFYKGYDSRHNGVKKIQSRIRIFIKFRYYKKAIKIWKKVSQSIGKFKRVDEILMTFLEYCLNFNRWNKNTAM